MGQWDVPILVGGGLIAGYVILTNPDLVNSLFPAPTGNGVQEEPGPTNGNGGDGGGGGGDGGNGGGGGDGGSKGDGGYDCARACRNCWCRSYNDKCGGSCSRCSGGNRIASKCGGQGVEPSGGKFGSTGGTTKTGSSKAEICGDLCRRRECSTYQKTCSGSCKNCTGSSSGCKSMCSGGLCGSYKSAGCSKSGCPSCAYAFLAIPNYDNLMRVTLV